MPFSWTSDTGYVARWLYRLILVRKGFRLRRSKRDVTYVKTIGEPEEVNEDNRDWCFTILMSNGYRYRVRIHQDRGRREPIA